MIELAKLSRDYAVRRLSEQDADEILALMRGNPQFYRYCGRQNTREELLTDLRLTPPGVERERKYYVGLFDAEGLAAVLDLIDGYPGEKDAYLGFFMLRRNLQGRGLGSRIVQELFRYLASAGYAMVRLGIDKGNPQSTHFWKKNGFTVTRQVERDGGVLLAAERPLEGGAMDFLKLARSRYSVLEYEQRPVEREKIEGILDAALAAPTACNRQPQRILVIDSDEKREKLDRVVPSRYYVPAAFLVCCDRKECWTRPMDGKSSGDIDVSIVTTHMMLEATQLGLGSIWVMYWDPEKMRAEFSLPEGLEPTALLIVGYRAADAHPRPGHLHRKRREEILL